MSKIILRSLTIIWAFFCISILIQASPVQQAILKRICEKSKTHQKEILDGSVSLLTPHTPKSLDANNKSLAFDNIDMLKSEAFHHYLISGFEESQAGNLLSGIWRDLNAELINPTPSRRDSTDNCPNIITRELYTPEVVNSNKLIVWIFVHGGNSEDLDQITSNRTYSHIKRAASWYSTVKKQDLELLFFNWSGGNEYEKIKRGAEFLSKLFNKNEIYNNCKVVLLGHGHSANLINWFTNIKPDNISINLLIYLGCPKKNNKYAYYQPKNYKMLLYFYSDSDWETIKYGDNDNKKIELWAKERVFIDWTWKAIKNSLGLSSNVAVVAAKSCQSDMSFNNSGFHDFEPQGKSINIGYRVKLNACNPSHEELMNVVELLPEIIEKTIEDYPICSFNSDKFHLDLDTSSIVDNMDLDKNKVILVPFDSLKNLDKYNELAQLQRSKADENSLAYEAKYDSDILSNCLTDCTVPEDNDEARRLSVLCNTVLSVLVVKDATTGVTFELKQKLEKFKGLLESFNV